MKSIWSQQTAAKIDMTQKSQRQDSPATAINPDAAGASAGPANGARVNTAVAVPRVLGSHISAITPAEFDNGAAAKVPAKNRNARMDPVFGDNAQAIWKSYR